MRITVLTIVPEFYNSVVDVSLLKRGINDGVWSFNVVDIKNFGIGNKRQVDDYSYGGGGMIMRADVLSNCIESTIPNIKNLPLEKERLFITTSPRGNTFNQKQAEDISSNIKELYILCNRFEGIDQRIIDYYQIKEVSIGNYILLGGESASLVIIEATVRLLDGLVENKNSTQEESFSLALERKLEYDQFTRPKEWMKIMVPDVLTSGDHKKIKKWREESSRKRTLSHTKQD